MSDLEQTFVFLWNALAPLHIALPEAEYRFDKKRRWRFDFAWPNSPGGVAVELEGGVYSGGRHTRGKGYEGDLAKYNAATSQGWRVLRYTAGMLKADPHGVIDEIVRVIELAEVDRMIGMQP